MFPTRRGKGRNALLTRRSLLWIGAALIALGVLVVDAAPAWAQAVAPKTSVKIDGEYGVLLPPDVSVHGHVQDELFWIVHVFMGILFVAWGIFFVYCLVRFRQRANHRASCEPIKAKPSKYSEIAVAVIEAVLLLGFSIPIWASVKNDIPPPADNPLRLRVVGEQFAWNFHYPGADGKFGRVDPKLINTATNPLGLDRSGDGADDIYSGELHIPVGRPVICEISSKDVIHSFFLPVMRVKQDAIPGMRIPVWFEAAKTGTYEVACAQLCGNNHYSMRALMVIQEPEAFEKWLVESSKPPEEFED